MEKNYEVELIEELPENLSLIHIFSAASFPGMYAVIMGRLKAL